MQKSVIEFKWKHPNNAHLTFMLVDKHIWWNVLIHINVKKRPSINYLNNALLVSNIAIQCIAGPPNQHPIKQTGCLAVGVAPPNRRPSPCPWVPTVCHLGGEAPAKITGSLWQALVCPASSKPKSPRAAHRGAVLSELYPLIVLNGSGLYPRGSCFSSWVAVLLWDARHWNHWAPWYAIIRGIDF